MLAGEIENLFCLTYMALPMYKYEADFIKKIHISLIIVLECVAF